MYNIQTSNIQETNDHVWQVDSVSGNSPETYTAIRYQAADNETLAESKSGKYITIMITCVQR